jgi:sugar phosphate isomerase/epimerase
MRVGVDTFTLRTLKMNACQTLDFVKVHGLEGAQFGGIRGLSATLDGGELRAVRQYADSLGLYTHVSVSGCNPCLIKQPLEAHRTALIREIEAAAATGWHELHSSLGGGPERYDHPVPWTKHLAASTEFIRSLRPPLKANGSRINLETHGDSTTFELVRLLEDVGPDIAGICLDTANVLVHAEEPLAAIRRAAPYTHLTHLKDGIIYFSANGFTRQGRPPGQGVIDWRKALPMLAHFSPDLPLSIEDHKWLFEARIFDPQWIALHPDLTAAELGQVGRIAWECQSKIASGEWPNPEKYEAVPWEDELIERLHSGRDHLRGLLAELALHSG